MDDMISRQAAIDICTNAIDLWHGQLGEGALVAVQGRIKALPSVQSEPKSYRMGYQAGYAAAQRWIPCSERLPECEQEVLICTKKKVYVSKKTGMELYEESIVTPALYEDGTMLEVNSKWHWEDIDYAGWDEEEDCGIIPGGWWENRHFNPDETYNNVVDREVIAWMPLPTPWEGGQS